MRTCVCVPVSLSVCLSVRLFLSACISEANACIVPNAVMDRRNINPHTINACANSVVASVEEYVCLFDYMFERRCMSASDWAWPEQLSVM